MFLQSRPVLAADDEVGFGERPLDIAGRDVQRVEGRMPIRIIDRENRIEGCEGGIDLGESNGVSRVALFSTTLTGALGPGQQRPIVGTIGAKSDSIAPPSCFSVAVISRVPNPCAEGGDMRGPAFSVQVSETRLLS